MIYYKEEKKKLVIPSGFVMIPVECDEAIEQAREQGYQEGFADGSSATCDTEEGTYSLTDSFDGEETVFPSEGKTGFNKFVIVDDGYGDKKYGDGVESQKGKLESITFTRNGNYTQEDGWSAVTVAVPKEVELGSLIDTPPRISDLTNDTYINTFNPQQAAVDGWGKVEIGLEFIIGDAKNQQKALMSATTFTQNGVYRREDGWNEVIVNVSSGSTPLKQDKTLSLLPNMQSPWEVLPDSELISLAKVTVEDNGYGSWKYDQGFVDGLNSYSGNCIEYGQIKYQSGYTEGYQSGYTAGLNDCSGGTPCDCSSAITEAYQSGYTAGLNDCSGETPCDCSSAITQAYDEGYRNGYSEGQGQCPACEDCTPYYDNGYNTGFADSSQKIAYFGEPAWVDTNNNTLFSDSGMGLIMEFTIGSISTGETLHLLNNSYDGNLMVGVKSYFSIDFEYTALTVTFYDGVLGFGRSYNIAADSNGLRYNDDTYRLIVRTLMSDTGDNRRPIQFVFINESRGETYELSQNSVPNFVNGTVDGLRINCQYNETSSLYSGMCSGWYLKYLKIYKMTSWLNRTAPLANDIRWKDNTLTDIVTDVVYGPNHYNNGEVEWYQIPSAEDTMFLLW